MALREAITKARLDNEVMSDPRTEQAPLIADG